MLRFGMFGEFAVVEYCERQVRSEILFDFHKTCVVNLKCLIEALFWALKIKKLFRILFSNEFYQECFDLLKVF